MYFNSAWLTRLVRKNNNESLEQKSESVSFVNISAWVGTPENKNKIHANNKRLKKQNKVYMQMYTAAACQFSIAVSFLEQMY